MAALLANETSTISNVDYLDRGYADPVGKLTSLGADIARISARKIDKVAASV
jgi:UDP-N-acetylglucosamine enolpyruvyl transferase